MPEYSDETIKRLSALGVQVKSVDGKSLWTPVTQYGGQIMPGNQLPPGVERLHNRVPGGSGFENGMERNTSDDVASGQEVLAFSFFNDSVFDSTKVPGNNVELLQFYRSIIYTCVTKNATAVTSVPLKLYAARTSGQKMYAPYKKIDNVKRKYLESNRGLVKMMSGVDDVVEVTEHPFLDLMHDSNSVSWSGIDALENTQIFLELMGNSYWWPIQDNAGIPRRFFVLQTHKMFPMPDFVTGDVQNYFYLGQVWGPSEIVHFAMPSPLSTFQGFGPGHASYYAARRMDQLETFERSVMRNGVTSPIFFSPEDKSVELNKGQIQRLQDSVRVQYAGESNAGKPFFIPFAVKATLASTGAESIAALVDKKPTRDEICNVFGVPVSKLDVSQVAANSFQGDVTYARDTILPRCLRLEGGINRGIIKKYRSGGKKLFAAFDNPVPNDREFGLRRATFFMTTSNLVTKNQVLRELELPTLEGPEGQEMVTPAQPMGAPPMLEAGPGEEENPEVAGMSPDGEFTEQDTEEPEQEMSSEASGKTSKFIWQPEDIQFE